MRKPGMVRIPVAREMDPGIGDSATKIESVWPSARHGSATLRIVENKGKLGGVERARAAVEDRRLPLEPVIECWRGGLSGLSHCHGQRSQATRRRS